MVQVEIKIELGCSFEHDADSIRDSAGCGYGYTEPEASPSSRAQFFCAKDDVPGELPDFSIF